MATIWNDAARTALVNRFEQLAPGTPAKWGKFTVGKMVKHCADGVRMAMGELPVQPKRSAFGLPVLKCPGSAES